MAFICRIDTGGTFTDAVDMDPHGQIAAAKTPSTPQDFSQGVMAPARGAVALEHSAI